MTIINLHEYDLVKAITRSEAKAVHKDLPPGGVWRTIRGHHVYIKDGKVIAGSIPGVTKAKKATKAHLAEHQEHIDKEAKKKAPTKKGTKTNASTKKVPPKSKTTAKGAPRSAQPKPATGAKPKPGKATAKPSTAKSGSKAPSKEVPSKGLVTSAEKKGAKTAYTVTGANGETVTRTTAKSYSHAVIGISKNGKLQVYSFNARKDLAQKSYEENRAFFKDADIHLVELSQPGEQPKTTDAKAKGASASASKTTTSKTQTEGAGSNAKTAKTKPATAGKAVPGAKKTPTKSAPKNKTVEANEQRLARLASTSDDGMDMWSNALDNPEDSKALKEVLSGMEGKMTEKLDKLFKQYNGGSAVSEYAPDSTKKMNDFKPGRASVAPTKLSLKEGTRSQSTALASAPTGADIELSKDFHSLDEDTQKHILAHETGHVISNAYAGLASHILDNPEGALGRVNNKQRRFEGVGGTITPEESWAEAFASYHSDPKWLKEKHPKAYDFVQEVIKKVPASTRYLDKAYEELDRRKGKPEPKPPAKKSAKDIRTGAQKNRELAYDVGDKVGGARKDDYEARFKETPTLEGLANLEKDNGAVAEKLVTKANLLPKFNFEEEHANGTDLPTALLKKAIFDRIAPKPTENTPEERKAYMQSIQKIHRHLAGIKTFDNMKNAVHELSDIGYKGAKGYGSQVTMDKYRANPGSFSYINEEYHNKQIEEGNKAKAQLDMLPLGNKLENFFVNYDSRKATFKTVAKNASSGWDTYLNPETKAKNGGTPKGGENKKWERKAVAEHLRKGGSPVKVAKPEDMAKQFGLRGIEFGHWVNDASGKYHLQRSAEAFSDLAGILGIDDKDVSLNGRLAIAFGARGKGGALAHYESDRKVINMTKHGGAGSLAHEWGHAMDNILYQYMNGGKESLGLASEHISTLGDHDPKLKELYKNLVHAMQTPPPGEKGAMKKVTLDSTTSKPTRYYPRMRTQIRNGTPPDTVFHEWTREINNKYDSAIARVKENRLGFYKTDERKNKEIAKYERQRKTDLNQIGSMVAYEMQQHTGKPFQADVEIPTGESHFHRQMMEMDGERKGKYFSKNVEMFARVFESYVEDKLTKNKQSNNYLVHGTTEADVVKHLAPFPKGKEREHIFKAMGNLLKHLTSKGTLKKALLLEVLARGRGDMTEELRKSLTTGVPRKRSAFNVENPEAVIYIPTNRLHVVYQTDEATNWDKVNENFDRMKAGENLEPVTIGLDYDIHDGHHRYEASKMAGHEHIPCIVKGGNDIDRERAIEAYNELWKSFDESKHKRDQAGKFTRVYHTTKDKDFKHDPNYTNSGQEWGRGLYTAPAEDVEYWHRALADKATGERHPYVRPMDISGAKLLHTKDIPDRGKRAKELIAHFGSGAKALEAMEREEKEHVTGETYGIRPHEIAEHRVYAKINGYDGFVAHDPIEGHQVVLFDDSKVRYEPAMGIDEFLRKKRHGEL